MDGLDARGVRKRFGDLVALDGFDLRIASGEIVGLVGHNGAGKTTFVEIVAGLAGLRGRRQRAAIAETSAALGLSEVLDRQVGHLSGGQRRRTQAATALVHRPRLLLLDEPTAGADPATRRALLQLVRRCAEEGTAVCYTTHYLPELADLDATIAVAARGRIIARGTQAELLAGIPAELRVVLSSGEERVLRSTDPARSLAGLVEQGLPLQAVDVRQPSLDDLYHALEAGRVVP